MSPSVETLPPSRWSTRSHQRSRIYRAALLAVAGVAALWAVASAVRGPATVDHITIDNASEYDIHIDVRPPGASARLPVGVADQHCATSFEDVIDQGSVWVIDFRAQDHDGGRLTIDRAQLQRDHWTIHIPDAVVEAFRDGVVPPPRLAICNT